MVKLKPRLEDSRSKQVWMTVSGQRLCRQTNEDLGPMLGEEIKNIPEEYLKSLINTLTTLCKKLDNRRIS